MCVEKYEQDPNFEKHDMHAGSEEGKYTFV